MIDLDWKIHFPGDRRARKKKYSKELDAFDRPALQLPALGRDVGPIHSTRRQGRRTSFPTTRILALALAGRRPQTDEQLGAPPSTPASKPAPRGKLGRRPHLSGFSTRRSELRSFRGDGSLDAVSRTASAGLWPGNAPLVGARARLPPPTKLATNDLPRLLDQLDQFWDLAPEPGAAADSQCAPDERPAAGAGSCGARRSGNMADPGSIAPLITALGDSSKMVQSTAAWALRMILSRRQGPWRPAARAAFWLPPPCDRPNARRALGARRGSSISTSNTWADDPAPACGPSPSGLNDPVPFGALSKPPRDCGAGITGKWTIAGDRNRDT